MKKAHGLLGIEMRHLVAFEAVVATGSFARAAEQLGYTQSAVSLQIAALERAAGNRLLDRPGGRKPVVPTDAGSRMLATRGAPVGAAAGRRGRSHRARRGHGEHAARGHVPERVDRGAPRCRARADPGASRHRGAAARGLVGSRAVRPGRARPARHDLRSHAAGGPVRASRAAARSLRLPRPGRLGGRRTRRRPQPDRDRPPAADRLQPQHVRHGGPPARSRHRAERGLPHGRERRTAAARRGGGRQRARRAALDRPRRAGRRRARCVASPAGSPDRPGLAPRYDALGRRRDVRRRREGPLR